MKINGVVLCGGMGSGKDTIARWLEDTHGYEKIAIAQPLYEIVDRIKNINNPLFYQSSRVQLAVYLENIVSVELVSTMCADIINITNNPDFLNQNSIKPRQFLQDTGEIIRKYDRFSLTKIIGKTIRRQIADNWTEGQYGFVVSDVRTLDDINGIKQEIEYIKKLFNASIAINMCFIRLDLPKSIVIERIKQRDGGLDSDIILSMKHPNEEELKTISTDVFDMVIDGRDSEKTIKKNILQKCSFLKG